jgi:hypothetical protein
MAGKHLFIRLDLSNGNIGPGNAARSDSRRRVDFGGGEVLRNVLSSRMALGS